MFASSGEKLEEFDVFHPDRMASRILDLGDMLTLIEQAERTFDADQAASMAGKLASGEGFTLEDFVEQLAMVRKLGPIGNLLGMLPGAAQNREALSQIDDKDLDRAAAIVNSMTKDERRNPKIINGSRRARIAGGSGVTVGEVNQLIVRFLEGQKMMRQMMGGIPGMGGARRGGQKARGKTKKKGKGGGRPAGGPGSRTGGPSGGQPAGQPGAQPSTHSGGPGTGGPGAGGPGTGGIGQLPPGFGRGGSGPAGIPGLGDGPGLGRDGGFKLPPGFPPQQPGVPAGLRGPQSGRRGKTGRKGR
jgi:signal recognition particle subunit SRP54